MPRIFNEKQRNDIKNQIVIVAREEFRINGFIKTSIGNIAQKVGIATGTFYNFFSSKEALFFEIMGEFERDKFKLIDSCFTKYGNPKYELKSFLETMYQKVLSDPIFDLLYKENLYERIIRKIPQEELLIHMKYDIDAAEKILSSTQPRDYLNNITAQELTSHLRAIFMTTIHKDEIGMADFDTFIKQQIDIFVNGVEFIDGGKND